MDRVMRSLIWIGVTVLLCGLIRFYWAAMSGCDYQVEVRVVGEVEAEDTAPRRRISAL